ncbi:MAG: phosphoribosyltransferase [Propionibacteriaceae bacterium]
MFADRAEAGRQLAQRLDHLREQTVVVLGLPRGGVPVGFQVAAALDAPLDVIVVRKLGLPRQPELAFGAIAENGLWVLDPGVRTHGGTTLAELREVERREQARLERRVAQLRRGRPRVDLTGRVVVIVDDGLATGLTARAACRAARQLGAARIVLAVPVAPPEPLSRVPEADEQIRLSTPSPFIAVSLHYRDFAPTSEEEVLALLDAAAGPRQSRSSVAKDRLGGG